MENFIFSAVIHSLVIIDKSSVSWKIYLTLTYQKAMDRKWHPIRYVNYFRKKIS